jgi:hypothetical protein
MSRTRIARQFSLGLLVFSSLVTFCFGQGGPRDFHWDWRNSKELNFDETLSRCPVLSPSERSTLIQSLGLQNQSPEVKNRIRVKAVQIAKNFRAFIAQGTGTSSCSPTGNCEFWVVKEVDSRFSILLHRRTVQTFTIQPKFSNGARDLVLGMHGSATQQQLTVFRFNGSKYRFVACYEANWETVGRDGQARTLKEPEISSCTEMKHLDL